MDIMYNGNLLKIEKSQTLSELLIMLNLSEPFAVVVNNKFVPRSSFNKTMITSGDSIDIVYPMVGG